MVIGRRMSALAGVIAGVVVLLLPASPASAQTGGPGAQATPVVGASDTAACPTTVGAAQVVTPGPITAGPFVVAANAVGSCTSFSANSQGFYTIPGTVTSPQGFSSGCQTAGLQNGGGVFVPAGTTVSPPGQAPFITTSVFEVTTANTPVVFPGGTTAVLNQVTTTPTTVTRTAIVSGNTQIGRVICGAANVYPLAVDVASASPAPPALPVSTSGGSGGMATTTVIAFGALALAVVAAQLAIGRRMWHRKGDVAG